MQRTSHGLEWRLAADLSVLRTKTEHGHEEPVRPGWCPSGMPERLRLITLAMLAALVSGTAWPNSPPLARCAVRLNLTANIKDPSGKGVRGAELWYVDTLGGATAPTYASLIGSSDVDGSLQADVCYVDEVFYCAQRPVGVQVLRFLVFKEGYGAKRLDQRVNAARLVKDGWALGGEACKGMVNSYRIGEAE
jgi:hypothetical protein